MSSEDSEPRKHPLAGSPARFAATLVAALVATWPAFRGAFAGDATLPGALARFLVAFAVFWIVGSVAGLAFRHRDEHALPSDMSEMVPGSAVADR